jgi:hypothetical protein
MIIELFSIITTIVIIVGLIKFFQLLFSSSSKKGNKVNKLPYKKKDYFFSIAEKNFFNLLKPISQELNYEIFSKVRLEDLFWLPKMDKSLRMHYRGKIRSRHIDFVLCDKKNNYKPVLGIQLNDSSHKFKKVKEVDDFKNKVFKDSDLPLISFWVQKNYNNERIKELILESINL